MNKYKLVKILLLSVVGVCFTPTTFANDSLQCKVHMFLKNKENFSALYINEGDEIIYEDTTGLDSNTFIYNCKEPKRFAVIINNDPTHLIRIFIHPGEFELHIDLADYTYYFVNSELNILHQKMLAKEDSLKNATNIPNSFELYKLLLTNINKDSMMAIMENFDQERARMHYSYYKKDPKSYLALEFIWIQLNNITNKNKSKQTLFTKKNLFRIFKQLPDSYINYTRYKECLELFKSTKDKSKEINKPIWNGK